MVSGREAYTRARRRAAARRDATRRVALRERGPTPLFEIPFEIGAWSLAQELGGAYPRAPRHGALVTIKLSLAAQSASLPRLSPGATTSAFGLRCGHPRFGPATALLIFSALSAACGSSVQAPSDDDGGTGGTPSSTSSSVGSGGAGGESPEDDPFEPAPGGVRRLLPQQIVNSVELVFGGAAAQTVEDIPTVEPLHGFASIGAAEIAVNATDVGEFERIATNAAAAAVADPDRLIELSPCIGDADPTEECYADAARDIGLLAWRRPLDEDEVERLAAIGRAGAAWSVDTQVGVPFEQGLKYELMAMIQSPSFLYMVEVGTPDPEDPAKRILNGYELATRISFFIQGRTPSANLLASAESGQLDTPDGIRQATRELLESDRAKDALDAFYAELFYLDDLSNISKDPEQYPDFDGSLAASMREETRLFMRDLVWDRDADAREMFTSASTFVDPELAALYGVDAPASGWERRDLPASQQRVGLLGHASFLARFAHPGATSPTRRGHYLNARFLCDEVPPPPPGVTPGFPDDPGNPETMREKLARHASDPACSGCHMVMDPLGLSFEHFDAIGAYRDQDGGLDVDVTGQSEGLGSFSGPRELGQLIADDDRTPRCVVQNFVRSSLGHYDNSGERFAVRDLGEAFAEDGYKIRELMVELTASPLFRYVGDPK